MNGTSGNFVLKDESFESLNKKLKLHINKTCINNFGLLLSRILYYYGIIVHLVSGHLHKLHLYLYLRYCIRYLCFVLYMFFCDSNCIFIPFIFMLFYSPYKFLSYTCISVILFVYVLCTVC